MVDDTTRVVVAMDWNGTLVDDPERAWHAASIVLGRRGIQPLELDGFLRRWCLPLDRLFVDLGVPVPDVASAVREWNNEVGVRPADLSDGAVDAVRRSRATGARVGVISGAALDVVERDLQRSGTSDLFDFVIGDAHPKRDHLRAIGLLEGVCLVYVGDTEYDIIEAREADAWAVGYSGGYRTRSDLEAGGADFVIDRLDVLPDLVLGLDARVAQRPGSGQAMDT